MEKLQIHYIFLAILENNLKIIIIIPTRCNNKVEVKKTNNTISSSSYVLFNNKYINTIINSIPEKNITIPVKKIPMVQPYLHNNEKMPEPGIIILKIILIIEEYPNSDFNS